jgi:hypothetical protein
MSKALTLWPSPRLQVSSAFIVLVDMNLTRPVSGIAACNIGGVTIHSFAGIGLGIETAEVLADKVKKNRKASTRWLRTKVLIVDEGEIPPYRT